MIVYIAQLINFVAVSLQTVLFVASFVGKIIVSTISGITTAVLNLVFSVITFFQIVYEDNIPVFTEDLPNFTNDVINAAANQLSSLHSIFSLLSHGIHHKIISTATAIKCFVDALIVIVSEVLLLIKNAAILVGDTLWFILMFLPIHLPQIIRTVLNNIIDVIVVGAVDTYMFLLNITNFLTDVPLQSFIGITGAIVIVRPCIHFKDVIISYISMYYWSLVRNLCYYYYAFYNYFIDTEVREIARMSSGNEISSRDIGVHPSVVDDGSSADALCVICQERQKCVLTLPCRHVCLCIECCMRLYGYQRTCPICRTFIYHSVTVYL